MTSLPTCIHPLGAAPGRLPKSGKRPIPERATRRRSAKTDPLWGIFTLIPHAAGSRLPDPGLRLPDPGSRRGTGPGRDVCEGAWRVSQWAGSSSRTAVSSPARPVPAESLTCEVPPIGVGPVRRPWDRAAESGTLGASCDVAGDGDETRVVALERDRSRECAAAAVLGHDQVRLAGARRILRAGVLAVEQDDCVGIVLDASGFPQAGRGGFLARTFPSRAWRPRRRDRRARCAGRLPGPRTAVAGRGQVRPLPVTCCREPVARRTCSRSDPRSACR